MHFFTAIRFCLSLLVGIGLSLPLIGQEAGVSGTVSSAEGETLIGATVKIIGSVIGDATDIDGHYHIEVPPGRIRLLVSYIGFENFDTTFRVEPAEREIHIDIVLSESFVDAPEAIVFGRRATGQAQALRNQQSSIVNQTIIHSELFNKYPDVTMAETVSRLPGVSIIRDAANRQIIQLQALPEQYTAVALNGQRLPTIQPEEDQSGSLDIIQSNLVEEVCVIRARTADMDGDAIAGLVDFHVRQPEEKFEVLLQAGTGNNFGFDGNPGQKTGITQLAGVLNSELSEEKVYALAAGSYLQQNRGTRQQLFEYGQPGQRGTELYSSRPGDINRQTERAGLVGAIELRPSIYNRMRLSYSYNAVSEDVEHRQLFASNGRADEGLAQRIGSSWRQEKRLRLVALEVENNFPMTKLDYQLSFSESTDELTNRLRESFTANSPLLPANELLSLTPNDQITDEAYTLSDRFQDEVALEETVAIGSMNITRYLTEARNSFLRIGARYRSKDRTYGAISLRENQNSGQTIPAGTFAPLTGAPIQSDIGNLLDDNRQYDAKQRIAAGYAMYSANLSSRLSVSAGLRYEYLRVEARNTLDTIFFDNNNLLPSLNVTYRVRRDRQIRFSYYDAIGRPNYASYRPLSSGAIPLIALDQFSVSNPEVATIKSQNFDLAFERYGRRDGLISAGIFAKFLENPTLTTSSAFFDGSGRPIYVSTVTNAEKASVLGFELGLYQNLGFLKANSGLRFINVNGTYNFNAINVEYGGNIDDDLPLAQAPRQSANLSLVYNNPTTRLSVVVAGNYRGRVFDRLLDEEAIYLNGLFTLDLSADYELIKNISVYLRLNNLTDNSFEEWIGVPNEDESLIRSSSQYGTWGVVGVRFRPGE